MAAERAKESLGEMFSWLIAEMDGVRPEEVTVGYIHKQREENIYPHAPAIWFDPRIFLQRRR